VHPSGGSLGFFKEILDNAPLPTVRKCQRSLTFFEGVFVGPDLTINPMTSLNGSYMQSVLPLPQINYVALSPMTSTSDDLDPVVDMVISSVGLLEPDLLTPDETLDMCSF
jgi:hypothetical protein